MEYLPGVVGCTHFINADLIADGLSPLAPEWELMAASHINRQVTIMKPVSLQAVVNEMDVMSEEMTAYINRKTGELITISDEEAGYIEEGEEEGESIPEWQMEILPMIREVLESGDFVPLPDKYEIHEYSIMERFCGSVEGSDLREELLNAIRGRGAFRSFKDTAQRRGILDDWYDYRNDAFKRIAADFLELEGISFVDDTGKS